MEDVLNRSHVSTLRLRVMAATKRILIDGYFLGKPSGYGRFIYELCRALGNAESDFEFLVAVQNSTAESFLQPYPNTRYIRATGTNFATWEQVVIPLCALRNKCDIIHFPYNTKALLTPWSKTITTVHDLTFLRKNAERDIKSSLIHSYMRIMFMSGTRNSNAIVAVSEATKTDLLARGVTSQRIYNTVDGFIGAATLVPSETPSRPYFLHRGSYALGHRNTERIIQAFLSAPILTDTFSLKLLGVPEGASYWKTTPDQPVEYLPHISDQELASIYTGSSCVIAASLLEGFCLPIVEAFGFGSPVITSNIDPMMEIAGGAALLVNPQSVEDIADAMLRIACDKALARDLAAKGRSRLPAFASSSMAAELLDLYRRVLSGGEIAALSTATKQSATVH
ncbi:MAG: glycosyltransferase family 1 protein [Burkholderiaceae bacterium]